MEFLQSMSKTYLFKGCDTPRIIKLLWLTSYNQTSSWIWLNSHLGAPKNKAGHKHQRLSSKCDPTIQWREYRILNYKETQIREYRNLNSVCNPQIIPTDNSEFLQIGPWIDSRPKQNSDWKSIRVLFIGTLFLLILFRIG